MVEQFPLAIIRDRVPVDASLANPIAVVTALVLPGGAVDVLLHFGHGDPGRPLTQQGQTFEPDPSEATNGLFISNGLGAGTMVLDIGFVTYREPLPVVEVSRTPQPAPAGAWVSQLLRNFGLK